MLGVTRNNKNLLAQSTNSGSFLKMSYQASNTKIYPYQFGGGSGGITID
jgi:hypothetical protein